MSMRYQALDGLVYRLKPDDDERPQNRNHADRAPPLTVQETRAQIAAPSAFMRLRSASMRARGSGITSSRLPSTRVSRKWPVSIEALFDIARRERRLAARQQERRQSQKLVAVGLACGGGHGAPAVRRDVDQIVVDAGRGALREIETEAQLIQKRQFPAGEQRRPDARVIEVGQHEQRHLVEIGMGIALGQQTRERTQRREARKRCRIFHGGRRIAADQLDVDVAEVIGETRLPRDVDVIADLQHGPRAARAPAMHEAEVASVRAREHLHHGRGFAVGTDGQNHTFIGPVHEVRSLSDQTPMRLRRSSRRSGACSMVQGSARATHSKPPAGPGETFQQFAGGDTPACIRLAVLQRLRAPGRQRCLAGFLLRRARRERARCGLAEAHSCVTRVRTSHDERTIRTAATMPARSRLCRAARACHGQSFGNSRPISR